LAREVCRLLHWAAFQRFSFCPCEFQLLTWCFLLSAFPISAFPRAAFWFALDSFQHVSISAFQLSTFYFQLFQNALWPPLSAFQHFSLSAFGLVMSAFDLALSAFPRAAFCFVFRFHFPEFLLMFNYDAGIIRPRHHQE
jgi:hypothetical protein